MDPAFKRFIPNLVKSIIKVGINAHLNSPTFAHFVGLTTSLLIKRWIKKQARGLYLFHFNNVINIAQRIMS